MNDPGANSILSTPCLDWRELPLTLTSMPFFFIANHTHLYVLTVGGLESCLIRLVSVLLSFHISYKFHYSFISLYHSTLFLSIKASILMTIKYLILSFCEPESRVSIEWYKKNNLLWDLYMDKDTCSFKWEKFSWIETKKLSLNFKRRQRKQQKKPRWFHLSILICHLEVPFLVVLVLANIIKSWLISAKS